MGKQAYKIANQIQEKIKSLKTDLIAHQILVKFWL